MLNDILTIGGTQLGSRLFIGSAGYPDQATLVQAAKSSETELVTVSMRRINTIEQFPVLEHLRDLNVNILPNTAGCYTAKEAILTAQLAREALATDWIKLEVIGDYKTLLPDSGELLKAADALINDNFQVFAYCNDDPIICRKLALLGCAAVMPAGSPIGSGMGILNPYNIELIREMTEGISLVLDAGIGTASDVARAMELGCDAVLVNTAIAKAKDPIAMAYAMKSACVGGRVAYLAGRIPKSHYATNSTPWEGKIKCSII